MAVQITMSMGKGCAFASPPMEGWMVFVDGVIEASIPLLFVDLIGSLTRCGDHGLVAQFCRTRLMQFLGKVSMAFYLSHWVVLVVAKDLVASDNPLVPLPLALAPVCCLCSLAVACLVERYFETPIRRLLQG
uniref:Acyltransferase 3 domain-containing protein n=1 Tax=Alexandrium andersonii TaxID=327968 RepID=A0A7S2J1K2_9DINO